MKRILMSLGLVGIVGAFAIYGTTAFFSDSETSLNNLFQAGAIDLKVDSTAHYNGMVCSLGGVWEEESTDSAITPDLLGTECNGTWTETDLDESHVFFDYTDLKPGDEGENTISLHVYDNDAWLRFMVFNTRNEENGRLENEIEAGDTTDDEGELQEALMFSVFIDQGNVPGFQCGESSPNGVPGNCTADPLEGDNILNGAAEDVVATEGPIDEGGEAYDLWPILAQAYTAGSCTDTEGTTDYGTCHGLAEDGRAVASTTYYFGIEWNLPEATGNEVQTDGFLADIRFEAEQWRNNPSPSPATVPTPTPTPTPAPTVGAVLGDYSAPVCTTTISSNIQVAVNAATAGDTICVDDGTYAETVSITKDLTLAAVNDQAATITGGVNIKSSNVNLTGFTINPGTILGENSAVYLDSGISNVNVMYNDIDGLSEVASRGIVAVTSGVYSSVAINQNVIHDLVTGVYTNPGSSSLDVTENDFYSNAAGIGGYTGAYVAYNHFSGGGEALGVDSSYDGSIVEYNNFVDGSMINDYGATTTILAEDNFFGPSGGAVQAPVNVDFTPEAGSAYAHN